jgi:hypothetical protein
MKKVYDVVCTDNKGAKHLTIGFKTLKEALSFVSNQCNYISNYSMNDETSNDLTTFINIVQNLPFGCAVFHLDDYDYHYQIVARYDKECLIEKILYTLFKKF